MAKCSGLGRVSKTRLMQALGRPPERAFRRLIDVGLLPEAGEDGCWDHEVEQRGVAVLRLADEARDLSRRVVLLAANEGYRVPPGQLKQAVVDVLGPGLRPARRKMAQVRYELHLLARRSSISWPPPQKPRTFALGLVHERWAEVVTTADDATFEAEFAMASRYARWLPAIVEAEARTPRLVVKREEPPEVEVRNEERVVLVLVNLLLAHNQVREAVGLRPHPVRRGLDT